MKSFYYIGKKWSESDLFFFKSRGIIVEDDYWATIPSNLISLFNEVKTYLGPRWNSCLRAFKCLYTKDEILSSKYCVLLTNFGCGYPNEKPIDKTNVVHLCPQCHYDRDLVHNIFVSKVSSRKLWGFSAWNYDTLFASRDLYSDIFLPLGIKCKPVVSPSGKVFDNVVQLDIPVIEEDLDLPLQEYTICPQCGKKKYLSRNRYPFHPIHSTPLPNIYLSKEKYGEGWEASRKIFISTELATKLIENKALKYEWLIPCVQNHTDYLQRIGFEYIPL